MYAIRSYYGLDNLNDYYDVRLKQDRLRQLAGDKRFRFVQAALEDRAAIESLFKSEQFDYVVNLAAQAGVRYSLENPHAYIDSNLVGFTNVITSYSIHYTKLYDLNPQRHRSRFGYRGVIGNFVQQGRPPPRPAVGEGLGAFGRIEDKLDFAVA